MYKGKVQLTRNFKFISQNYELGKSRTDKWKGEDSDNILKLVSKFT